MATVRLDFLVPGFAKCGTTTLCALLREHPGIFMPARKDFRLFDLPDYERRWNEWTERFALRGDEAVIGDGSIWYTDAGTEEGTRQRILDRYPRIKLIFIARDPIDRIESAYREMHHSEERYDVRCPLDLAEALEGFPGILEDTCYGRRLDNYRRHVPESRLLVLFLEELVARPEETLARCFGFLGVDPAVRVPDVRRRLNPGGAKYHDSERLREMRRDPAVAVALSRIPYPLRNSFLAALDLRIPFPDAPLDWSPAARDLVRRRVADDAARFLTEHGKPLGLWPRLARIVEGRGCPS